MYGIGIGGAELVSRTGRASDAAVHYSNNQPAAQSPPAPPLAQRIFTTCRQPPFQL